MAVLAVTCIQLSTSGGASADTAKDEGAWDPWEKWSISAGAFVADLDNTVRIGAPGVGLEVDLEDALGLQSSQSVFRIDGAYRFGADNRHRVDFTWFDLSRDATRTLQKEVDIGGIIFPIGTVVDSEFDLAFYNLRYAYSFVKDDRVDFAGSLGLHITRVGLFISDSAGIIGSGGDAVTAPLPVVGMRVDVALTPKWYFRSSIEAMYLSIGDYTGSLVDILLVAEYRGWEHFALGLGVNSVRLEIENDNVLGNGFEGQIRSDFVGFMLYGRAMF